MELCVISENSASDKAALQPAETTVPSRTGFVVALYVLGAIQIIAAILVVTAFRFAYSMSLLGMWQRYRWLDENGVVKKSSVVALLGPEYGESWVLCMEFLVGPVQSLGEIMFWTVASWLGMTGAALCLVARALGRHPG